MFVTRAKHWLYSSLTFLSLTLLTLTLSAHLHAEQDESLIHVSAEGKSSAQPDQAELHMSFTATDFKADKARNDVDEQLRTLLKKLRKFELKESSLDSSQTQIHPQYDYRNNQQNFLGYQVNRNITFVLTNLEQLDDLLKTLTESKVSRLNHIQFGLGDSSLLKQEALSAAIQNSKTLAQQIAEGYEVSLGKIHSVSHHPASPAPQMRVMSMHTEMASTDNAPPTYQQKDLEFTAQVNVSFTFN